MKRVALIVCLSAAVMLCAYADVVFSGESSFSSTASIPPAEETGRTTSASLSQAFEFDAYGDTTSFYLNAGFVYDALGNSLKAFVSEAYADLFIGKAAFRFGRQKATWGNAEINSAVDVITPSDMSDPISMSKTAVDALKFSFDAFPFAVDLYWIPIFTPAVLPEAMTAMYEAYGIEVRKPEPELENGEVGMKVSAYTSAGDFSLYGYYGWEDMPVVSGAFPDLYGKYERLVMAGASAAVPVGDVTLKAEAAWYPKRDKVVSAMAGLEWMHDDLTLIGELYGEWDKESERISGQAGASVSYDLLDGDLELSVAGILELRELDGAVMAGVTYSFSDELKVACGAVFVFEGPDDVGTYGAFKDLSCVRLEATYSF